MQIKKTFLVNFKILMILLENVANFCLNYAKLCKLHYSIKNFKTCWVELKFFVDILF